MSYLKPEFSNHWGNYLFIAMAFAIGFLFSSFALAYTNHYYGPYLTDAYALSACQAKQASIVSPYTTGNSCSQVGGGYRMIEKRGPLNQGAPLLERHYYGPISNPCPEGYEPDASGLCTPPPPEPADCQEHADQNNGQGDYIVTDNFPTVGCDKGCLFEVDTSGKSSDPESPDFGRWISIINWTGLDCPFNGGYDDTKSLGVETKDVYPLDTDFQNCYRPDGTFLGRVGVDMTCPTFVNCWNEDRTHIDAVAPDPGSCPTGTQSDSERDWAAAEKNQTTTTTTNPDGTTDTTTTQQTEQTAPDGSKSTTTYTKTTSCDAQGQNCTTTETTSDSGATCEGEDCDSDQMTAENYDNCEVDLVCTGDVHQCAMLELQRTEVCRFEEITKGSAITEALQKADDDGELASVDGNGLLADGPQAVVNIDSVIDVNTMLADNGRSGSCPSPHDMSFFGSTIQFKYDSVCDAVEGIRPLVLLAASFLCLMMVGRAVLGTGKE